MDGGFKLANNQFEWINPLNLSLLDWDTLYLSNG